MRVVDIEAAANSVAALAHARAWWPPRPGGAGAAGAAGVGRAYCR
jgi:hypothetical protein